jgi:hypothetical protein
LADVFLIKTIKPKRLQIKEIRFEILNALRKEASFHRKELKKTVRSWSPPRPSFESAISTAGGHLAVLTSPRGTRMAVKKWNWADRGTRYRSIHARRSPYMTFQVGYQPRTRPRHFSSRRSRNFGRWVRVKTVRSHRIRPRRWTEELNKRRRRPFTKRIFRALERGSRKLYR